MENITNKDLQLGDKVFKVFSKVEPTVAVVIRIDRKKGLVTFFCTYPITADFSYIPYVGILEWEESINSTSECEWVLASRKTIK